MANMIVIQEPTYRCDMCQKVDTWKQGWISLLIFLGKHGVSPWEHEFHFCSEPCCSAFQKLPRAVKKKIAKEFF